MIKKLYRLFLIILSVIFISITTACSEKIENNTSNNQSAESLNKRESVKGDIISYPFEVHQQYAKIIVQDVPYTSDEVLPVFPNHEWENVTGEGCDPDESVFYGGDANLSFNLKEPILSYDFFHDETTMNTVDQVYIMGQQSERYRDDSEELSSISREAVQADAKKMLDDLHYGDFYFRNFTAIKASDLAERVQAFHVDMPDTKNLKYTDMYEVRIMQMFNGLPFYDTDMPGAPAHSGGKLQYTKQGLIDLNLYRLAFVESLGEAQEILTAEQIKEIVEETLMQLPLIQRTDTKEIDSLELLYAPVEYLDTADYPDLKKPLLCEPAYLMTVRFYAAANPQNLNNNHYVQVLLNAYTGEAMQVLQRYDASENLQ